MISLCRLAALSAAATLTLLTSSARAEIIELRHDTLIDHSKASAVCGFAEGESFGVRFTPPAYPARIKSVKLLLASVPLSPTKCAKGDTSESVLWPLEIFHTEAEIPGKSLVQLSGQMSNDTVLNVLDVSEAALSINSGSFFVSFTISGGDTSPMHDFSKMAEASENFIYADIGSGPAWHDFNALGKFAPAGNWVLRIDVDVPDGTGTGGAAGAGGEAGAGGDAGSAGEAGAAGDAGAGGESGASGQAGTTGDAGAAGEAGAAGAGGSGASGQAGAAGEGAAGGSAAAGAGVAGVAGVAGQATGGGAGGSSGSSGQAGAAAAPAPAPAADSDSGCATGRPGEGAGGLGLLAALGFIRRRRARQG